MANQEQRCRCNCGYSCGRTCGLEIMACMQAHYVVDCDHQWDGPEFASAGISSATCSKCGDVAIFHDMRNGP